MVFALLKEINNMININFGIFTLEVLGKQHLHHPDHATPPNVALTGLRSGAIGHPDNGAKMSQKLMLGGVLVGSSEKIGGF